MKPSATDGFFIFQTFSLIKYYIFKTLNIEIPFPSQSTALINFNIQMTKQSMDFRKGKSGLFQPVYGRINGIIIRSPQICIFKVIPIENSPRKIAAGKDGI